MINEMKIIIKNYLDNMSITKIISGKVVNVSPLSISINQSLTIPSELIYCPNWLKEKTVSISDGSHSHSHMIFNSLMPGDEVLMIRNLGGQKYFVLDVIKK